MSIQESNVVLAFKAGRAFRREGTNIVEPSPTKGAIYLTNGEDGLLHFIWKNRTTNIIEEVNSCIYNYLSMTLTFSGYLGSHLIPIRCIFCQSLSIILRSSLRPEVLVFKPETLRKLQGVINSQLLAY